MAMQTMNRVNDLWGFSMKRAQFVMALWGVTGLAAGLQAGDCDCPKTSSCKQCVCLDESGVLDHIDKVAGQFHASFKKNFRLISNLGKSSSSCEAGPSCGCEIKPSCGCEIKPSCGCEMKPSCGCEMKPSCGCEIKPSCDHKAEPSCGCELNATTAAEPQQSTTSLNKRPIQSHDYSPPNMVVPQPVPDAQLDPFTDEPRSSQSKVRGRTIQYRTNSQPQYSPSQMQPSNLQSMPNTRQRPAYGQQYNTQARYSTSSSPNMGDQRTSEQQRPLQLVAPASSETSTVDQVFKSAYRKSLSDSDSAAPATTVPSVGNGLRAVPSKNVDAGLSSSSSRNSNRLIVPTEPIRSLNDPYEREDSTAIRPQENPLRR